MQFAWDNKGTGCPTTTKNNLKLGIKNLENGYHRNEKKPKIVFLPEKRLELQIQNLVCMCDFTLGVTWAGSHFATLAFPVKAKNVKNGISAETLEPRELDP